MMTRFSELPGNYHRKSLLCIKMLETKLLGWYQLMWLHEIEDNLKSGFHINGTKMVMKILTASFAEVQNHSQTSVKEKIVPEDSESSFSFNIITILDSRYKVDYDIEYLICYKIF